MLHVWAKREELNVCEQVNDLWPVSGVESVGPHHLLPARDGNQEILRVDIEHSENAKNGSFAQRLVDLCYFCTVKLLILENGYRVLLLLVTLSQWSAMFARIVATLGSA